jgi:hypothetical protein
MHCTEPLLQNTNCLQDLQCRGLSQYSNVLSLQSTPTSYRDARFFGAKTTTGRLKVSYRDLAKLNLLMLHSLTQVPTQCSKEEVSACIEITTVSD